MSDLISREQAILKCKERLYESALNNVGVICMAGDVFEDIAKNRIEDWLVEVPSAEPQIIRCEDCKHSYDDIGGTYCSYGVCVDCVVDLDFFCRYGERREEE